MTELNEHEAYQEAKSILLNMWQNEKKTDLEMVRSQIDFIDKNIVSNEESAKSTAQNMIEFLLNVSCNSIDEEVIKVLTDSNTSGVLQRAIVTSYRKKLVETICTNTDVTIIASPWRNHNYTKLIDILEEICSNEVTGEACKTFLINNVIPAMLSLNTDNGARDVLVDMSFFLSGVIPISAISSTELNQFLLDVNKKYVIAIAELRDQEYPNWHKLWIFLVRYCEKNMHNSMELTNKLLRVVEFAFRNSNNNQRVKAYDCWKELISNANLDMTYICTPKQMKLLVTPLRAKFSKQEVVICKRFEVFTYLLEKLQHKCVLCLPDFLEFCFGSLKNQKDSPSKLGRNVPQLWSVPQLRLKCSKVLISLLGHSHTPNTDCISCEDVLQFQSPVISDLNFQSFHKLIVHSVVENCILLKDVDGSIMKEKIIKCLWRSVFNLILSASENQKSVYLETLASAFEDYLKQLGSHKYFENLLIGITTVLVSYDKDFVHETVQSLLKHLLRIVFVIKNIPIHVAENLKVIISHSFSVITLLEKKLKMIQEIMSAITESNTSPENASDTAKMWLCLADELAIDLEINVIEGFDKFNEFFLWPGYNLHHLDDQLRKQTLFSWMKLYRKLKSDEDGKKIQLLKKLETVFKNNPLLAFNVVSLLAAMSQFETRFSNEFVASVMETSSMILQLPNLKAEDEQKITSVLIQYFDSNLEVYKLEKNNEAVKSICTCITHVLHIHKGYKILETLGNFLKNCPERIRQSFFTHLSPLFLDMFQKETDSKSYLSRELQKVLTVFNTRPVEEKKTFIVPSGRSARIANLVKNSPRSPQKKPKKAVTPAALRLFGQDLDTLSPLKVKGSQLSISPGSAPPKSQKRFSNILGRTINSTPLNEEDSSDFVPIDTEVKLQPQKMLEHQREMMRKRREDIPALYQDLSQSTSQDIFRSRSNSNSNSKNDKDAIVKDTRKVIVEMIEPLDAIIINNAQSHVSNFTEPLESSIDDKPPSSDISSTKFTEVGVKTLSSDLFSSKSVEKTGKDEVPEHQNYVSIIPPELNSVVSGETDKLECPSENGKRTDCVAESEDLFSNPDDDVVLELLPKTKVVKKQKGKGGELHKLKMDIVGANDFLSSPRRSRRTNKCTKGKKSPVKGQNGPKPRKSLTPISTSEHKTEENRIKSIGVITKLESEGAVKKRGNKVAEIEKKGEMVKNIQTKGAKSVMHHIRDSNNEITEQLKKTAKPKTKIDDTKSVRDETANRRGGIRRKSLGVVRELNIGHASKENAIEAIEQGKENADIKMQGPESAIDESVNRRDNKRRKSIGVIKEIEPISKTKESDTKVIEPSKTKRATKARNQKEDAKSSEDVMVNKSNDKIRRVKKSEPEETGTKFIEPGYKTVSAEGKIQTGDTNVSKDGITLPAVEEEKREVLGIILRKRTSPVQYSPKKREYKRRVPKIEQDISKGLKRKYSSVDEDEDIIESSQESYADITPLFNSSKRKLNMEPIEDLTLVQQKTLVSSDIMNEIGKSEVRVVAEIEEKSQDAVEVPKILSGEESVEFVEKRVSLPENHGEQKLSEIGEKANMIQGERPHESIPITESVADQVLHHTSQDSTLSECTAHSQDSVSENDEHSAATQDTITQPTQETPSQVDFCSSQSEKPPVLYFDLPEKPLLTESEQLMCKMDTMSICLNDSNLEKLEVHHSQQNAAELEIRDISPIQEPCQGTQFMDDIATPSTSSLPSSPVTVDTPTRTSKLLNDTLDISPICSQSSSPPETEASLQIPLQLSLNFREQMEELDRLENEPVVAPEDIKIYDGVPLTDEENSFQEDEDSTKNEILIEDDEHRGGDVIEEIITIADDVPCNVAEVGPTRQTNIQERSSKLFNMISINSPVSHSSVSRKHFIKRRSGSTMSPSTGRIRRLMLNFNNKQNVEPTEDLAEEDILTFTREIPSPLAVPRNSILKRKFSDSTDSGDGMSPCAKRKRVNFSDPCLTSKKIFIKEEYPPQNLFNVSAKDDSWQKSCLPDEAGNTETPNLDTEPSLEIVDTCLLSKDKPIYQNLVHCEDDVLGIIKKVTSPLFINTLLTKLEARNIRTIGDLAQLSETEINRLPFKVPVVDNVYRALDAYWKKCCKAKGITNGNLEVNMEGHNEGNSVKLDLRKELEKLIKRATDENVPMEEISSITLATLDNSQKLSVFKNCNIPFKEILSTYDITLVVQYFLENIGMCKLCELFEERDSENFLEMVLQYASKKPLTQFIERRSIEELKTSTVKVFDREQILENLVLPLIETPTDISSYVRKLSVVQVADLVIQRLQNQDIEVFFERICCFQSNSQPITTKLLGSTLAKSEGIVEVFKDFVNAQNEEDQGKIMMEVFEFISGKLSLEKLVSLHIDFLKRLPIVASIEVNRNP